METIIDENGIFIDKEVRETHERLRNVLRAGWVKRNVSNPETVLEHSEALGKLVKQWETELGIQDPESLRLMLLIHDWPEIIHGDEIVQHLEGATYDQAIMNKHSSERAAMQKLCESLGETGITLLNLWNKFEESNDHDAKLGHQIDKLQAVMKALEYQKQGEPVTAKEFADGVRNKNQIHHPFLIKILEELERESAELLK